MKIALVFSGQGAQQVGMGRELRDRSGAAAAVFRQADEALGWSVSEVCFEGPEERLTESMYCQPAIYAVSCAALAALREVRGELDVAGVGGLSLGEYAALHAAGCVSFVEGLKLVAERAKLMDAACRESEGAMASVIGAEPELVGRICRENDVDVANYNCPGQIVVSGAAGKLEATVAALKEAGVRRVLPLKVAGAYHSRLMAGAGEKLAAVLAATVVAAPKVPLAQNFTGALVESPEEIRSNLVSQVAGSVRWEDCVRALAAAGAEEFIELGPGNVVAGLVKRTLPDISTRSISDYQSLTAG